MLYRIETPHDFHDIPVDILTLPPTRNTLTQALTHSDLKRKIISRAYLSFKNKWIPIIPIQLNDDLVKSRTIRNGREKVYRD